MVETLSVLEAAQRLGIGRTTAYRLARKGVIPALRLGKRLLIPRAAFERMLAQPGEFQPRREAAR